MIFDPTAPFCSFCYKQNTEKKLSRCSKCHIRLYCSRDCQASDWRNGHHKLFCGKAGEIGTDYEIRPVDGKGFGMFAKKNLQRNTTILVERSVAQTPDLAIPQERDVRLAIMALTPTDDADAGSDLDPLSFRSKFERNNVGHLCITFSRVNHDCIGNSHHAFDDEKGLILLVANHRIRAGEEITYSYTFQTPRQKAVAKHTMAWGFTCACRACKSPEIGKKLDKMLEYDKQLIDYGKSGMMAEGKATAMKLLKLFDEFQCSSYFYSRLYSDLYQMSISRGSTFKDAEDSIKLAYTHAFAFFGYESLLVKQKRHNMLHPADSPNYLALE